jgi:hypothetical protein
MPNAKEVKQVPATLLLQDQHAVVFGAGGSIGAGSITGICKIHPRSMAGSLRAVIAVLRGCGMLANHDWRCPSLRSVTAPPEAHARESSLARSRDHVKAPSTVIPSPDPVIHAVDPGPLQGLSANRRHHPQRLGGQHQLSTLSGTDGSQPGITGKRPTVGNRSRRACSRSAPAP